MRLAVAAAIWFVGCLVGAYPPPVNNGAVLMLASCEPSDGGQQLSASDSTVRDWSGTMCATYVGPAPAPLVMAACAWGATQTWVYNAGTNTFEGTPTTESGCVAWNAQGGNGQEGAGSLISTWPCDQLSFNSFFTPAYPFLNVIGYNFTSPTSHAFSGLCADAVNPPPLPVGTPQQIAWQETEMACFYHYNMATMAGTQGCGGCGGGAPPDIALWNPTTLDTDAWIAAGVAMGCKRFIYVAKHACGFAAWNSSLSAYPYSANNAPNPVDVVRPFVASAKAAGVGYGFYYTTTTNQFCNVCSGKVNPGAGPGQLNVTQAEYDAFVLYHLKELWGQFGPLAEVWFDGGYPPSETAALQTLFQTLQPNTVAFQGFGLMPSPVRWVGSETGIAPYPCWSTTNGNTAGAGDPDGTTWMPAETDFTLQNSDNWFYDASAGVRSSAELRAMYEVSTGRNTALIIDFAPAPNGTIPAAQIAAATTLGAFIRGCYGNPVASVRQTGVSVVTLAIPAGGAPDGVDRVVVAEDQSFGQLIRSFSITGAFANGTSVPIASGSSVGNKYTAILPIGLPLVSVTLNVSAVAVGSPAGYPFIRNLAAYSCNSLAATLDAQWGAV